MHLLTQAVLGAVDVVIVKEKTFFISQNIIISITMVLFDCHRRSELELLTYVKWFQSHELLLGMSTKFSRVYQMNFNVIMPTHIRTYIQAHSFDKLKMNQMSKGAITRTILKILFRFLVKPFFGGGGDGGEVPLNSLTIAKYFM